MLEKTCKGCKETKPVSEFAIDKDGKYGVGARCRPCFKVYTHESYMRRRDTVLAQQKVYYTRVTACPEVRERMNARSRQYSSQNIEKRRKTSRESAARWRKRNPDYLKNFYKANPEYYRSLIQTKNSRRRTYLSGNGFFTTQEWIAVKQKYNYTCVSCNIATMELEADHIQPVSKGGSNTIDNIQPLCQTCNRSKSDKYIDYRPDYQMSVAIQ